MGDRLGVQRRKIRCIVDTNVLYFNWGGGLGQSHTGQTWLKRTKINRERALVALEVGVFSCWDVRGHGWRFVLESDQGPFVLHLESKAIDLMRSTCHVQKGPRGTRIQGECGRHIHSKCQTVRLTVPAVFIRVLLAVPSALLMLDLPLDALGRQLFIVWPCRAQQAARRSLAIALNDFAT